MPRPFQFRFGPATPGVAPPSPPAPPLWTSVGGAKVTWFAGAPQLGMPRLQHLYPQAVAAFGQPVTFAYRAQSEFAAITATGDELLTKSKLTA